MTPWTGASRNRGLVWMGLAVAVFLIALEAAIWGTVPVGVLVMNALLAVGIPVTLVIASRVRVAVTAEAFVVRWGPTRWPVRTIPWSQVVAASVVDVDPWRWGGWGYRWASGGAGWAAVVRRGPGIQLQLREGRRFTVTVDDAEAGAWAANAVLDGTVGQTPSQS